MKKRAATFLLFLSTIILGITTIFIYSLLLSFPVKWLWNAIVPDLFNLSQISYWQSFALLILTGLLFRSSTPTSNSTTNN